MCDFNTISDFSASLSCHLKESEGSTLSFPCSPHLEMLVKEKAVSWESCTACVRRQGRVSEGLLCQKEVMYVHTEM